MIFNFHSKKKKAVVHSLYICYSENHATEPNAIKYSVSFGWGKDQLSVQIVYLYQATVFEDTCIQDKYCLKHIIIEIYNRSYNVQC